MFLLSKSKNAYKCMDFISINLCKVFNKLINKLLNTRLSSLLLLINSSQQSGFIPDRFIGDNVLLTQELIYTLDNKVQGKNIILKLKGIRSHGLGTIYVILEALGFDHL